MKPAIVSSDSVWAVNSPIPKAPQLGGDTLCDVCIVGAGIAGLTTAYLLARRGRQVVVIDDGPLAGGQTQVTTAHLSNEIDDRYTEMIRLHGEQGARLAAESHAQAIDQIESIVRAERIRCNFDRVDGYLFLGPDQSPEMLDDELNAALRAGVEVERIDRAPLSGFDSGPCLRFFKQGQFHPLKYLAKVAEAIWRDGGKVYSDTHAKRIDGGDKARIETEHGPVIMAKAVVVATNSPVNDLVAIHTKQYPYRTYVIGARVPAGSVPRGLYWDMVDPYHYARLQPEEEGPAGAHEILIVGGEDHKSGHADDGDARYERLEEWSRERFPTIEEVVFHWSGQVMETFDGLAFIGRNPLDKENVFVATGDSGMGITHGTIAGMLLADLIAGHDNPWAKLYDPSRKTVKALGRFARENLDVALQYASWATPGEIGSTDELERGQGAVMRRGLQKIACYKNEEGRVIKLSATCPHLDCVVAWNSVERTWDCPCHGSQFTPEGKVKNGPANSDLGPAE